VTLGVEDPARSGALPAAASSTSGRRCRVAPVHGTRPGRADQAAKELHQFADGALDASTVSDDGKHLMGIASSSPIAIAPDARGHRRLLVPLRLRVLRNTLSLPSILSEVSPNASIELKLFLTLALFVIFALPGYVLAVWRWTRSVTVDCSSLALASWRVASFFSAPCPH